MSYARAVAFLASTVLCACGGGGDDDGGGGGPSGINLANYQSASAIIGQSTATGNTPNNGGGTALPGPTGLEQPQGHVALGSLYVADTKNNRVLGYAVIPTGMGTAATFALGVPNFNTVGGNGNVPAATAMNAPTGCCVAAGALFVADSDFERVLIWSTAPTSNVPANVALGKPDLVSDGALLSQSGTGTVKDVCVAANRIVVADFSNNRVLVWNGLPTSSGTPADLVLGQPDFDTNTAGVTSQKMSAPASVWTDGTRLVVADSANNRVLIWTTFPTGNGEAADLVIGQPDFVTSSAGTGSQKMNEPWSVTSDGVQLFVADRQNQRVLIYDPFPTNTNAPAVRVLGQSTFTNTAANDDLQDSIPDAGPSARTFWDPSGVSAIGNQLFVSDKFNHRVLVFTGS